MKDGGAFGDDRLAVIVTSGSDIESIRQARAMPLAILHPPTIYRLLSTTN
jgi:hypothetical protein